MRRKRHCRYYVFDESYKLRWYTPQKRWMTQLEAVVSLPGWTGSYGGRRAKTIRQAIRLCHAIRAAGGLAAVERESLKNGQFRVTKSWWGFDSDIKPQS